MAVRNLSQETLAEACDISARTVQRIEKGTVVPHAFTLQSICRELDIQINADGKSENGIWLATIHFSSMSLMLPVPLFIWAWKGSSGALLAQQSKQALNFHLTWTIAIFTWFGICTSSIFLFGMSGMPISGPQAVGWVSSMWFAGPIFFGLFVNLCFDREHDTFHQP